MKTKVFCAGTASAFLALAAPLLAHHSFSAEYDATKPVQMIGVVTKVEWMNPHVDGDLRHEV